jgi:glycosyltransferase involved in cell wall biosynthesis
MKFSVIIPLYNKAAYIEEAVRSAVDQERPALEIIVVDDGSTDDGPAKVLDIDLPGVRLISQPNGGVAAARNAGIEAAQGDYVCFLDADDCYRPGFLAAIALLAERYPEAGLLATSYVYRHADGHHSPVRLKHTVANGGLVQDFYAAWNRSCFFFTSSLAIKRNVLSDRQFRFPVGERLGEDQDLWFRIAEHFPIAFVPSVQAEYRLEVAGSATHGACVRDELPVFRRLMVRLGQREVPTHLYRSAGRLYASHVLNVANARLSCGDRHGAWAMVSRKEALANPLYWLRTALRLTWLYGMRRRGAA